MLIIPTYKRANRLTLAIDSVLKQSYLGSKEIIVVDDNGNTPYRTETYSIVKPYLKNKNIKYIAHDKNKGGCKARNTGASIAKGTYLTFLDDDDFYEPNKIKEQVAYLLENPNLDACACGMYRIDEVGNQIISEENFPRGINLKEAILDGNLFTGMLMIKRHVFKELNGFSEIPRFQDKYFHYKFLNNGHQLGLIQKQLCTLIEHKSDRISFTNTQKVLDAIDILYRFEYHHESIFSSKEWKFINHRKYYSKAYSLANGTFQEKMNGLNYLMISLKYGTRVKDTLKLGLKTITPNFTSKT
jgi:glycosyltransferase involved in cell wall biosynthesis